MIDAAPPPGADPSRTLAERLLDRMAALVVVVDAAGRIVRFNRAAEALSGMPADAVIGRTLCTLLPDEFAAEARGVLDRLAAGGAPEALENEWRSADAGRRRIGWSVTTLEDADGPLVVWTGVDLTDRRQRQGRERARREAEARSAAEGFERALDERDARFGSAFHHAGVGMALVAPGGALQRVNPAFCRIVAREEPALQGVPLATLATAEDAPALAAALARLASGEADAWEAEQRWLGAAGEVIWVQLTASVVRSAAGVPLELVVQVQGIDERREAVEALRRSHDLLRAVTEGSVDAIYVKDREGRYLHVNGAGARALGRPPREIVGRTDADLMDAASAREVRSRDITVMVTQQPLTSQETLGVASGTRVYSSVREPLRDPAGAVVGVVGVSRDVTEQQRAAEALFRREREFAALVENSPDLVARLDPALRFLYVNPAVERATGLAAAAIVGRPLTAVVDDPERAARLVEALRRLFAGDAPQAVEFSRPTPAGEVRLYRARMVPERAPDGAVESALCVTQDVTEQVRLEEQLREAQKLEAVGRLAGGVAHDFNNLLTAIQGHTELLLLEAPMSGPQRGDLLEIRRAAERAADLTRQLLAFSRKQVLQPQTVDVGATVRGMERMLRGVLGEDLPLEIEVAARLWTVRADPLQLEQVVLNLVANARDAMPRGGRLRLAVDNVVLDAAQAAAHSHPLAAGAFVRLTVEDSGQGIAPEVLPQIFEPFFTTRGVGEGSGLGLATVYGIVKQSGGSIAVDSEVGVGTTVRVYLPRADAATPAESAAPAQPPHVGAEVVLLVEDEASVRTLARRILQRGGYEVVAAESPAEALLLFEENRDRIDLLLTDVVMPGMNGRQLADLIVEERPELPVLFMSGYTDDALANRGVGNLALNLVSKPFGPAELIRAVRDRLAAVPSA